MFTAEFEKTAKEKEQGEKIDRAARVAGGALAGGIGAQIALTPMSLMLLTGKNSSKNHKQSMKLFNEMNKHHGLKVEHQHGFLPSYTPDLTGGKGHGSVKVDAHKHPSFMAHEMGHAIDFKNKSGKLHLGLRTKSPLASMAAAGLLASSDDEKKRKYAPAVAAAGYAPMLWQEAKASHHATTETKRILGSKAARDGVKKLLPAFGTYAALPVATYLGAKHLLRKKEDKK